MISGVGGGIFILLLLSLLENFCGSYRGICKDVYGLIVYLFFPLPFVFLLSLITYKMRDEVFRAWWGFAVWFVPMIIAVTFLLENAGSGGGYLGMQKDFNFLVLFVFYSIFIITSLVRIILAYRRLK